MLSIKIKQVQDRLCPRNYSMHGGSRLGLVSRARGFFPEFGYRMKV